MIKSVEKAAKILIALSNTNDMPMRLSTIAENTNLNKSTCVHILNTLCSLNFVQKISRNEGYQLGPYIYYLARDGKYRKELVSICDPIMKWLYKKTGQTVLLTILYDKYELIIHYLEGEKKLDVKKYQMIVGNIYSTATGRLVLAHQSKRDILEYVKNEGLPLKNQWPEVTDIDSLLKLLRSINDNAYVRVIMNNDEVGYACGLYDGKKHIAALGMATKGLLPNEDEIVCLLRKATKEINRHLTFTKI